MYLSRRLQQGFVSHPISLVCSEKEPPFALCHISEMRNYSNVRLFLFFWHFILCRYMEKYFYLPGKEFKISFTFYLYEIIFNFLKSFYIFLLLFGMAERRAKKKYQFSRIEHLRVIFLTPFLIS